ncbi:MAG: bifunctional folylpolyglutamate synthase/dihydrofolate synthase [Deltaproteobacteria bacterium HGW-Deltaproteobacteria-13]|jgi:dihydrofolate synthase/folylpolyglutamate synthase|nr:MAG: bifunctional folylpolyglutamate synthase/dihydrofolate synthase [Deltaproteobacteria bacterium HGW-Deltaproteobacteria-13]
MNQLKSTTYLAGLNVDKMHFGLKAITRLLSRLGNPQDSYKTILIAGTNGKGSTAAMTSSILSSAGYKAGLYTSPHLVDVRERIVINGKKIPLNEFNRMIAYVKDKMEQPVTYFEFLTAVALVYFQNQQVDIAVLEVGLGGRLDATNVCRPLVSVITNIAFDHTAYLGNTLESITREKAGIIKRNGVCITAAGQKKVLDVLEDVCLRRRSKLYRLHRDIKIKKQKDGLLTYRGLYRDVKNLTIPLRGEHQRSNAAMALAAIELCAKKSFPVDDTAIYAGLKNTRWEARMEIIQDRPLFLLDGAHNPAGIDVLCRSLKNDFSSQRLILIFGALADKDYRRMLQIIAPLASKIILTQIKTGRAVPVNDIMETVKELGYAAIVTQDVNQAIKQAMAMAGEQDLICATGSFYLAGEIKQAFRKFSLYDNKKPVRKIQPRPAKVK